MSSAQNVAASEAPSIASETKAADSTVSLILTILAGVSLALFSTAYTPLNTDLGWMLDFGRQAAHLGHLPLTNARSFIEPNHPVILHEWLSCLLFYWMHARWGAAGLIVLRWLCVAATMTVIGLTVRRATPSPAARLLTMIGAAQMLVGAFLLLRSQLATVVLLALVTCLALFGSRRSLWACLPLFALWANLHGGWMAGVLVLAAALAARGVEQRRGWRAVEVPVATLVAVPVASAACLLLNPYGPALIAHTFHHVSDGIRLLNREWTPLWHAGRLSRFERIALLELLGCVLLALPTLSYRRLSVWVLLLLGVGAAVSANRNLRIAPILMAPAVAMSLGHLDARLCKRTKGALDRFVPLLAALLVLVFSAPLFLAGRRLFRLIDYSAANPGTALWVMRRNHLTGRVWNDFNWGGMMLWVLPDTSVACDGRNVAAYSQRTLRASMLFGDARDPVAVLSAAGADMALLPRHYTRIKQLARVYTPIYCDDQACILSRIPAQIEQAKRGLVLPPRLILASELFDPPTPEAVLGTGP